MQLNDQFDFVTRNFKVKSRHLNYVQCYCPAHNDKEASLTITKGNDRVLLHCHAGCNTENILQMVGLKMSDLFCQDQEKQGRTWQEFIEFKEGRKIEEVYDYFNTDTGDYAFTRLRLEDKRFRYGRMQGEKFIYGLNRKKRKDIPAVYSGSRNGISEIKKAISEGRKVFYVEGEKDVKTLVSHGYPAVTCGAAGDWTPICANLFRNADVVILADNDSPGLKLAREVKSSLENVARATKIVVPCPEKQHADISDYFEDGHSVEEFEEMIQQSPEPLEPLPMEPPARTADHSDQQSDQQSYQSNQVFADIPDEPGYDYFLTWSDGSGNKESKPTGVYDIRIFEYWKIRQPLFFLNGTEYIYTKSGLFCEDILGAKLKKLIAGLILPRFLKSTVVERVYKLFLQEPELQAEFSQLNAYPDHWVPFLNGLYDPIEDQMIAYKPEFCCINQIPHEYNPRSHPPGGQIIEQWLDFITEGKEDDREMLLQFAGLCLTKDTTQQVLLVLCGEAGTGKSVLIRLIEAMVGERNASHISLEELQERFAVVGLMGKTLNSCADLRVDALENVATLKKVLGEDSLRGERKGRDAFSFRSYAKLIYSTNELPAVKNENSNGFYRRLLVLQMNRKPDHNDPHLFERLINELPYFIHLAVDALQRMYKAGNIAKSQASRAAVERWRQDSDPVHAFLVECCTANNFSLKTRRVDAYEEYIDYCKQTDRYVLKKRDFFKSLRHKGYQDDCHIKGEVYFRGFAIGKEAGFVPLPEEDQENLPFN